MSDSRRPFAGGKDFNRLDLNSKVYDHDDNGSREKRLREVFGIPTSSNTHVDASITFMVLICSSIILLKLKFNLFLTLH